MPENRRRTGTYAAALDGHRPTPWELQWPFADTRKHAIHVAEEAIGEPGVLIVVPPRGIVEIALGESPNDEPTRHVSVVGVEFLAKTFPNDLPTVTGGRIGVQIFQAHVENSRCQSGTGIASGVAAIRSQSDCG